MQTLMQAILDSGLGDRVICEQQLARLVEGSAQRRYNLVNRALAAGELVRLRRGRYLLARRWRARPGHPFALAQALRPGSYVSFETALSFHGWIPETTPLTACVVPGRKSSETVHPLFGHFRFSPLAINEGFFLEGVDRLILDEQAALVAQPPRALLDTVCRRKLAWQGRGWLVDGMRIDADILDTLQQDALQPLQAVYKHHRMHDFITALSQELGQ